MNIHCVLVHKCADTGTSHCSTDNMKKSNKAACNARSGTDVSNTSGSNNANLHHRAIDAANN